jgi:hypothetical protein
LAHRIHQAAKKAVEGLTLQSRHIFACGDPLMVRPA